ncbi:uncharacterized protein K02A2.6-like [Ostrea edulis]|uniref:uncharacterized protein K02A2.6-like n=1 Tax=Ostrea edulis TaxID=37623 RepID=UPI0024AF8932|nr:uncharacterized protein K02A2.6-like [Ostrea edulis]
MPKFNPPESFDFSRPSEWPEWKQRFCRYRTATKLDKEDEAIQISSLIYAMGLQAEHIVKSFVFGDGEDETKFEVILKKYDDYFVPKRNVIHERAKFHLRSQAQGESVETFIRSLHELSEHCDFANRSEAIRDRLVIGINDKGLSEKLQLTKDLTLEKASEMARNSELVKSQIRDLQSKNLDAVRVKRHTQDPPHQVNRGRGAQRTRGGQSSRGRGSNNQNRQNANLPLCGACNCKHYEGQCPAHGRRCRKCNRRNHFAVCCRSNTVAGVREIVDDDNDHHDYFLGSVTACNEGEPWFVKLKVCGSEIPFKIDTGADISIMSEYTYKSLPFQPKLHVNNSKLQTPNGDLHSLGKFKVTTRHKNHPYSFHVVVIPSTDSQNNLLSRSVASTMGLIQKIGSVIEHHGTMKGDPVKIVLRSDAQQYCVTTARRIPFALMPKVKAELDKLENDGIIRKINEPTDWCAPTVPATKKNGDVRICIDLKRLNEAVKREYYMLPNLDDISPKLSEATIFSKLDAASGFHQLKLHEDSQKLTTFITPFGRYCYTRVPFGISSAPEIFQRRMGEVLSGLEGVESIIDDVIIYGSSRNEHDRRLKAALDRIRDAGIKLNPNKCEYRKEKIEYFGHIISKDGVQPSPERVRSILDLPPPTNISELRRIIGMINYLGRFVPDLSSIMNPINNLLKSDTAWTWDESQQSAFDRVKKLITEAPVLAFYDMTRPTIVSADASSFGIGAALFQVVDGETKTNRICVSHTYRGRAPHYPQANGEAESVVKVAKRILKQPDVFLALMAYRSTPVHATGTSPSELIMGRKIRTTVPIGSDQLEPGWPDLGKVREKDRQSKHRMRVNFNRMHGARILKPLYVGDRVRVKTDKEKSWDEAGIVTSADYANRSYFVKTLSGDLRRNRKHLLHVNDEMQDSSVPSDFQCSSAMEPEPEIPMGNQNSEESLCTETTTPLTNETPSVPVTNIPQSSTPPATVRRSGREIKRPKYLSDYLL